MPAHQWNRERRVETALAVEPDAPQALITRAEAIRITVQANLSAKFSSASETKKSEQGALVEYYAVPDQRLLWVDENGLTERGKVVMAEIARDTPQGGTTAVRIPVYAGVAPSVPPAATRPRAPRRRGTGRHRR